MKQFRRLILALVLSSGLAPALAQVPPVPALPDAERRTSYSISASTCACSVGFQLYGDSTDVVNWLEVFVNGVMVPQSGGWTISSPTGPIATIPRPITDAVLTFATAQTGTVQIVGARRPRRTSQFQESQPVPTRNFNVVFSDITATLRELWDKTNDFTGRSVRAPPGETLNLLPVLASRANMGACFDSGGNLTSCVAIPSSSFAAGNGILFTGTNPTTINNNIQAGPGILITGTNPMVVSAQGFDPSSITNCTLIVTVSGNALTGALKTQAGSDPTATTPCTISFANPTIAIGDYTPVNVTAATSFSTGTSGSTFGSTNNVPFKLWWFVANNSGAVVLGAISASTPSRIFGLDDDFPKSTTACSACTNANAAGVYYTTSALASKAIRAIAVSSWEAGLPTAGTWTSGPTTLRLRKLGTPMPGQATGNTNAGNCPTGVSGNVTSNATTGFIATSATTTLTPSSAANFVSVTYAGEQGLSSGTDSSVSGVLRGGTLTGPAFNYFNASAAVAPVTRTVLDFPQTTALTTWAVGIRQTGTSTAVFGSKTSDGYCTISASEVAG